MQPGRRVLLDDERAPAVRARPGGRVARRLAGDAEIPLPVVFGQAHGRMLRRLTQHASVANLGPHAEGSAVGGGGPLAHLHGARRLPAQGRGRHLLVPAARLARREEGRAHHPRGDGSLGRLGGVPARGHPGRAVEGVRALAELRRPAAALQGSQGRRLRHRPDARGGDLGAGARRGPELAPAAAEPLSDPDQVPRRAAAARRPDARARVHHEGRVFVPRRRQGRAARIQEDVRDLPAHLHALRPRVPRRRGGHRQHRRLAVARVPGADRDGRRRAGRLRQLRLRGQRRAGGRARAEGRAQADGRDRRGSRRPANTASPTCRRS